MPPRRGGDFDWDAVDAELQGVSAGFKDPKFDPIAHVLNLLSSGDADHQLAKLRVQAKAVDTLVERVVDAYFAGFNRALRNYSSILQRFEDAQERLEAARLSLGAAAPRLDARPAQVGVLRARHAVATETLRLMDAVERAAGAPARVAGLAERAEWAPAAAALVEGADLLARPEMLGIPALRTLREQLAAARTGLVAALLAEVDRRAAGVAERAALREARRAFDAGADLSGAAGGADGPARRRGAHSRARSVASLSPLKPMLSTALARTTSVAPGLSGAGGSLATPAKPGAGLGEVGPTPFSAVHRRRHSRGSPAPGPRLGLEDRGHLSDPAVEGGLPELAACLARLGATREAERRLRGALRASTCAAVARALEACGDALAVLAAERGGGEGELGAAAPPVDRATCALALARGAMAAALMLVDCLLSTLSATEAAACRTRDTPGVQLLQSHPPSPGGGQGAAPAPAPGSPADLAATAALAWHEAQLAAWMALASVLQASRPSAASGRAPPAASALSPRARLLGGTRRALSFGEPGRDALGALRDAQPRFHLRHELEADAAAALSGREAGDRAQGRGSIARSASAQAAREPGEEVALAVQTALARAGAAVGPSLSAEGATDRAALTVELYPAIRTFLGDGERLLRAKAGPGRAEGGGPAALEDRSPSLLEALSRWSTRGSPSLSGSPGQGPHPIAGPLSAHLDTFLRHDFLPEAYTALQSRLLAILEADDAERGGVPEARARLEAAEELVRTALQWSSAVAPCGPDLQGMAENVLGAVLDAVARPALQAACAPLGPAAAAALSLPWAQRMALEPAAKLLWSLDAFACEDGGADGAKPQVEALGGGGERAERDLVRRLADLGQRSAGAFRRPSSAQEADWRALCTLCSAITALVDGVVGASAALPPGETDADAGLAYILDRFRILVCRGVRVLRLQLQLWLLALLPPGGKGASIQSFEDLTAQTLLSALESHASGCLAGNEVQYIKDGVRTVDEYLAELAAEGA